MLLKSLMQLSRRSVVARLGEKPSSIAEQLGKFRCRGVRSMATMAAYTIDVYLDVKSPHSYLMVKPALQLQDDYDCTVTFKPCDAAEHATDERSRSVLLSRRYDLSYVAMGISTVHDPKDPKRRPANAQAERRAKMYYTVARCAFQRQASKPALVRPISTLLKRMHRPPECALLRVRAFLRRRAVLVACARLCSFAVRDL